MLLKESLESVNFFLNEFFIEVKLTFNVINRLLLSFLIADCNQ